MSIQPGYEDANLILRLYELRREPKLRQAREWFTANFKVATVEEFDALCPPGSETNAYFRMVVSYWEMAASFVAKGVLNAELFYESAGEMLFVWERVKDSLPRQREALKHPYLLHNMEQVAAGMVKWHSERAPGFHAAFQQRVRGTAG